ncbi:hypothetical protein HK099_006043 [Clydaea vesicula]|uniref:PhoD-like phosphatase domain-containing protein n=1 Tax=Clydaea vesicula TaxID=447962 RepID=A0AAD5Y1Z5_9FUNG|nr:hypothetical protein HK099_006043 [Clydaea vesicula]
MPIMPINTKNNLVSGTIFPDYGHPLSQSCNEKIEIENSQLTEKIEFIGPFLKYVGTDSAKFNWLGSVLIITKELFRSPTLTVFQPNNVDFTIHIEGFLLDHGYHALRDKCFWRFDLRVPLGPESSDVEYGYYVNDEKTAFNSFYVAGRKTKFWNWSFYSCNGFNGLSEEAKQEIEGVTPLWRDVMFRHAQKPMHVMIGGGDQVYADQVWTKHNKIKEWLSLKGKQNRAEYPWSRELEDEISSFYYTLYVTSWEDQYVKNAFASIPQVNVLDDHDIWDGYGSYPEILSNANVYKGCGKIAIQFYLLFQHHTTMERASIDGYFGKGNASYNFIREFGPSTAVLLVDSRCERTVEEVVSQDSWEMIFRELNKLTCQHLIVVTGVPVIHPRMKWAETQTKRFHKVKLSCTSFANGVKSKVPFLSGGVEYIKKKLGKGGLLKPLINQFGLPELDDDLMDHWTHPNHIVERRMMVEKLQEISRTNKVRVTFLAGDVHLCTAGKFFNAAFEGSLDCHLMYQVTSSAIGNVPPPKVVVDITEKQGKKTHELNSETYERMIQLFQKETTKSFHNDLESLEKDLPTIAYNLRIPPIMG